MTIDQFILHHFPVTRSARVKWLLHELVGDAFEVRKVDLYNGGNHEPDFLLINPNHNVPVLEIIWSDGRRQVMLESAAMVAFLADAYPQRGLAPSPSASPERADYMCMLHFGGTTMDMMLWQVRIHEHVLPETERDTRTAARYRDKFTAEVEPQLAARLETTNYICGDVFTAADCVVGHCVFWARGYGLCQQGVFKRYLSRLSKRPAFVAAFADAKEFTTVPPVGSRSIASRFTG